MNEKIQELLKKDRYSFGDLCAVMTLLRGDNGCPWDREQTHESIRQNFIEETYEVVEAIDNQDKKLLCEELGDVLLQVVFHAQIEKEAGSFDIDDVSDGIVKKLIYRHPHIFGEVHADTAEKVLDNWEMLKAKEKHRDTVTASLRSVPRQLPALMRAQKVGKKAAKAGFDFPDAAAAEQKITEELAEVRTAAGEEARFEEIGDLLFAAVNTARKYGVDAERALGKATDKFIARFALVEETALASGKSLSEMPVDEQNALWDVVKLHKNSKSN